MADLLLSWQLIDDWQEMHGLCFFERYSNRTVGVTTDLLLQYLIRLS
jgi:hypothetical protein